MENIQQFKTRGKDTFNIIGAKNNEGKVCFLAECYSQYGWEDGCQDRDPVYVKLSTLKCLKPNDGDAFYCGSAKLEGVIVNPEDYTNKIKISSGAYDEKGYTCPNIHISAENAEKLGLIKSCFPKGKKIKKHDPNLSKTGQILYFPILNSNKYYRAVTKWEHYMGYNARFEHYFFKGIIDNINVISHFMNHYSNNAILFAK